MSDMQQLVSKLEACVANSDIDGGKVLLNQAKVAFLHGDTVAAQGLECGVLLSLQEGDLEAFSRFMSLLMPFYFTQTTPKKHHVLGLHLMHLLVEHRLSEFHSVLEVISEQDASTSQFLSYPIGLERQLMVGMYDEIMSTPIPDPSYQFFVNNYLQQTVRDSIAEGMEVSYSSLSLKEASSMMKFDSIDELKEYVSEFRQDWIIEDDARLAFAPVDTTVSASDIAAQDWIQQSLQYATELERIV
mmetsp:Transcript_11052/g.14560  ORF Transcript_11052/g.14560 Transcript_11052/m.14560 type:complete len:244 (+) Transcript_11052:204-935(+)|eukprot:CAMPEP_0198141058 /NCGR_PEP_ID=MMETSP1443-20131203/4120_1 /TAXON_ID=186043 /ORGANISM="Entomoneis sp., Strain CCMP2396" /LENGTH=243 /DNA_ID=CAMNT_0043803673 /DNA_START=142 /DNA_END=873 /DNA_ORIENTATION=-